jgi:hypothetical protein
MFPPIGSALTDGRLLAPCGLRGLVHQCFEAETLKENAALSLLRLFAALTFVIGMSVAASAQTRQLPPDPGPAPPVNRDPNTRNTRHAPELNPATGATALALLTGGILVLRGRKR